jgi:hypothetical protein
MSQETLFASINSSDFDRPEQLQRENNNEQQAIAVTSRIRSSSIGDLRLNNAYASKFLLNKKCWICLVMLEFEQDDLINIQKFFFDQNRILLSNKVTNCGDEENRKACNRNKIKLRLFKDKFVLSVCKCRKKLAHKNCFNNYIDLKQKGNVKIDITCSQCNYKYEFFYQYNSNG